MNILPGQSILANSVNTRVHLDTQHRVQKQAGLDAYSSILHNKDWQKSREMLIRSFQREGSNNQSEAPVLNLFRPSATNLLERRCPESAALAMIAFACKVFGDKLFEDGQPDPVRIEAALDLLFAQQMPDCRRDIAAMLSSVTFNSDNGTLSSSHYHIKLPTELAENIVNQLPCDGFDPSYFSESSIEMITHLYSGPEQLPDNLRSHFSLLVKETMIRRLGESNPRPTRPGQVKSWIPFLNSSDMQKVSEAIAKNKQRMTKLYAKEKTEKFIEEIIERNEKARARLLRQETMGEKDQELKKFQNFLNHKAWTLATKNPEDEIVDLAGQIQLHEDVHSKLTLMFERNGVNNSPNSSRRQELLFLHLITIAIFALKFNNPHFINPQSLKKAYSDLSERFNLPPLNAELFDSLVVGSFDNELYIGTKNLHLLIPHHDLYGAARYLVRDSDGSDQSESSNQEQSSADGRDVVMWSETDSSGIEEYYSSSISAVADTSTPRKSLYRQGEK